MKRLVIGDIHGHWDNFKKIYDKEDPDEVIILGDYFDNFHGTVEEICNCFANILVLKKIHEESHDGKFIILLGNHDFHYICDSETYSGYNWHYAGFAQVKLKESLDNKNMQIVYIDKVNKTIYSHAGITNTWLKNSKLNDVDLEFINNVNLDNLKHKGNDKFGDDIVNGPLWVRPNSLLWDIYEDKDGYTWTQIVGHTHIKNGPLFIMYDGTMCYGSNQLEAYKGKPVEGRDSLIIGYVMDTMPDSYMVEDIDDNTSKIISRKIKYTRVRSNNLTIEEFNED